MRAHALNKADLVANGLQLTNRFIVIQQLGIKRRKIAIAKNLCDFFALQTGCADNRQAIEIPCPGRIRLHSRRFGMCTHEVCEASLYAGGGGVLLRNGDRSEEHTSELQSRVQSRMPSSA